MGCGGGGGGLGLSDMMIATSDSQGGDGADKGWTIYGHCCQLFLCSIGLFFAIGFLGHFIVELIGLAAVLGFVWACGRIDTSQSIVKAVFYRTKISDADRARVARRLK